MASLQLRGHTYYIVLPVPLHLRQEFPGQKEIRLSSRTSDERLAKERMPEIAISLREKLKNERRPEKLKPVIPLEATCVLQARLLMRVLKLTSIPVVGIAVLVSYSFQKMSKSLIRLLRNLKVVGSNPNSSWRDIGI